MRGIVISVWGQNGTGKTVLSAALTASLSVNFNVLLASPDKVNPAFALWLPDDKRMRFDSIGSTLEYPNLDVEYLTTTNSDQPYRIVPYPGNESIGLLGYLKDDDIDRYNPIEGQAAKRFIDTARSFADITLIDGSDNPQEDGLTMTGLLNSDIIITLIEPNAKGISFTHAMKRYFLQCDKTAQHFLLAGSVRRDSPIQTVESVIGRPFFDYLPDSDEVRKKINECRLFSGYKSEYGEKVARIAQLVEEVIQDETR
jgi:hypothetical protein